MPQSLVTFLKYVGSELEDSEKDYDDPFVKRLQETVRKVKSDREMGVRYMLFEEMLKDEFNEGEIKGKRDVIIDHLSDVGIVSQVLEDKLATVSDRETLRILAKKAARVSSIEEFEEELDKLTESK